MSTQAVLMCGGLGTRLRPFTSVLPKPLLPVGDRSVLERLLERLRLHGITEIYLSVGYKAEMIEWVLRDGSALGVNLQYVPEKEPLGTAGALVLLRDQLRGTFLMMNGDLITKLDFDKMIAYHREHKAEITVGTKNFTIQVPYGVIEDSRGRVVTLREKPTYSNRINCGIYVVDPSALDLLPEQGRYDATQLIEDALKAKRRVFSYLIEEYWLDMGRLEDYDQANADAKRWIEEEGRDD
ncbi:MAG TPA: sugar phosphate nucleotidyltransferase [Aggregatilineales bacterium]|nr:sugar phosphate nucleotidyltransferase [Aggregatilineales bacterium]